MTRSNRIFNRILLALAGLVALAVAGVLAWPSLAEIELLRGYLPAWPGEQIEAFELSTPVLASVAAGAATLVVLCLAWILSRGRGRTSTALRDGAIAIDASVVDTLVRDALGTGPDVTSARTTAHRVGRRTALHVRIDARPGADLRRLVAAADRVTEQLGATLGTEVPLLVHITSGLRARTSREQRAV